MADKADSRKPQALDHSRRELLKRFGVVGAASVVPEGCSFKPRHHLPRKRAPRRRPRGGFGNAHRPRSRIRSRLSLRD